MIGISTKSKITARVALAFALLLLFSAQPMVGSATAQDNKQNTALIDEFYQLIAGKWARILVDSRNSIKEKSVNIAAGQCRLATNLDAKKIGKSITISKTLSQQFSKLIVYQTLKKGLMRIDLRARQVVVFPDVSTGTTQNGMKRFELSNSKGKIRISFAKLKQGNVYVPVMVEGKALFIKCPDANK